MHHRLHSILLLLFIPSLAGALGLGNLNLNSALNEPFDARIRLLSPTADELDSLTVRLADSAAFARIDIDRPAVLSRLKFTLDRAEQGADTIHITSAEPIREPFLNFLVEVGWSNGRLFREYTVLLDPPLYDPDKRITEFSPAETRLSPPAAPRPSPPRLEPPAAAASDRINYRAGDYGPIGANDTLWSIASATRPSASISTNQMMLALLRANPDAFITQNINGLRLGRTLRMPSESDLNAAGGDAEILAEVLAQHATWQAARESAAAITGERPELAAMAMAANSPRPAIAPAGLDSELRLVSVNDTDALNQQAGAAAAGNGQDLILARESIESLRQENLELMDRLTENENLIEDLQRLLSLKDSEMAALQAQLGRAEAIAAEAIAETPAAPATALEQEQAAAAGTRDANPGSPGAFLSANPLAALGGAGLLLALLILLLLRFSKGREAETDAKVAERDGWGAGAAGTSAADSAGQETGSPAADKDPTDSGAGEQKKKTGMPATKAAGVIVEEESEENPSHEVNTYLAFEQFDQAEKVARDAIATQPDNPELHIKLLEVFYTAGNTAAYQEAARALHELTGDAGEHWQTAMAMWSKMSPGQPLFSAEQANQYEAADMDHTEGAAEEAAGADREPQDMTDVTPVGGLSVEPAPDQDAGQSAEAEAARADTGEALLDFDPAAAATEKEDDMASAPGPGEAPEANQIATAPAPAAEADADIELDLSELDTAPKPLAAPDGEADDGVDLDLSELDASPVKTDDAPDAPGRAEDMAAEDRSRAVGSAQPPMDNDEEIETVLIPRADQPQEQSPEDQIATQLDLARAYIEIGDKESAKDILDEVMAKGNADQRQQAEELSGQI